jgi:hypothetical protein
MEIGIIGNDDQNVNITRQPFCLITSDRSEYIQREEIRDISRTDCFDKRSRRSVVGTCPPSSVFGSEERPETLYYTVTHCNGFILLVEQASLVCNSEKRIRKAVNRLAGEGYLTTTAQRYPLQ